MSLEINGLVSALNDWGDLFCEFAATLSVQVAILFVILLVLDLSVLHRVRASVRYAFWSLIIVKLLLPVNLGTPVSLVQLWPVNSVRTSPEFASQEIVHSSVTKTEHDPAPVAIDEMAQPRLPSSSRESRDAISTAPLSIASRNVPAQEKSASSGPSGRSIEINWQGGLLLMWAVTVLALGSFSISKILQVRRIVARSSPAPEAVESLLKRCMKLTNCHSHRVRVRITDELDSPAICGFFKATILLPRSIVDQFDDEQLRMILVHELLHWKRFDLQFNCLQTLLQIMHFYHPAIWAANFFLRRSREQAVDEAVLATLHSDPRTYSSTLLNVAATMRRPVPLALQLIGVIESRKALARRIQRILNRTVPKNPRLGYSARILIMLAGAVLLPMARTDSQDSQKNEAGQPNQSEQTSGQIDIAKQPSSWFELFVQGPDGKPLSDVTVEFRGLPKLTADQVLDGTFLRQKGYGILVKTNKFGRVVFVPSEKSNSFQILITEPGYGPYTASYDTENWDAHTVVNLTAELEASWSVGGQLVDENGEPVEGAELQPMIHYKTAPDQIKAGVGGGSVVTDQDGIWKHHSVPISNVSVTFEIDHPDFLPEPREFSRQIFGIQDGQTEFQKIELRRGYIVRGRVTDEQSNPIAGALVRTKFLNDLRSTTTDADGNYVLERCPERKARIVASAEGKATDMQEVQIAKENPPVNFQMKSGGHIRVVVQDEQGNPIPGAGLCYQEWRGDTDYFEFCFKDASTDENGVWEWNEAPLDEFYADICASGAMQLWRERLIAREQEYVFTLPPPLVIEGLVVDAEAKRLIEEFRVIPGGKFRDNRRQLFTQSAVTATSGTFTLTSNYGLDAHFIRVEADGYEWAESRDIKSDEGRIQLIFSLKPAEDVTAIVLTPNGQPAAKAQVALGLPGGQISIENGRIDGISNSTFKDQTDSGGRFRFSAQKEDYQLIVLHEEGFVYHASKEGPLPEEMQLTPWATIEGTFQAGDVLQRGVPLSLDSGEFYTSEMNEARIFTSHTVYTDDQGQFRADRVFPGFVRIGRKITFHTYHGAAEVASSRLRPLELKAGEHRHIKLGGDGTPVTGQFVAPPSFPGPIFWKKVKINLRNVTGRPVDPVPPDEVQDDATKYAEWRESWLASEVGQEWSRKMTEFQQRTDRTGYIYASVDDQGGFRIDDVPPGDYQLTGNGFRPLRLSAKRFTVGKAGTVQLGEIQLEVPLQDSNVVN